MSERGGRRSERDERRDRGRYDDRGPAAPGGRGDDRGRQRAWGAEPGGRADTRWGDDLSDPSELSGWRQRQAEARAQAQARAAAPPPRASRSDTRAPRRSPGPEGGWVPDIGGPPATDRGSTANRWGTRAPETGRHDLGRQDTGRVDIGRPDGGRPDGGRPGDGRSRYDAGRPDGGRPGDGRHDGGRPEGGRRGRNEPGRDASARPAGGRRAWNDRGRDVPGQPDDGRYATGPDARYDTGRPDDGRYDTGRPGDSRGRYDTGALDQPVPSGPGTQVLDRGWQDERPDADDDYDDAPEERGARGRRTRTGAGEAGPRPELPYVAGFDGLRAVALFAILAFHQGFEFAGGGFLGVSSFLTLSGFLVATIALAEWAQNGRLVLPRFWEHRARRIVPALVFTIAVVVVLQVALRVGSQPGFRVDVLAALGQVLNWRYALGDGGFASVLTDPSPVQHLWAMSLLVQLTVVLPLLFVGLMKLVGKRWRAAGLLFALLAAASFGLAALTAGQSSNDGMAYFGTHTRAGELLVGVVLAYAVLSPGIRRRMESPVGILAVRYGAPAALVALAVLWHSTALYSTNLFGGITAANALLTAWVIFALTVPGPLTTALGSAPLRIAGRLSYAAYLLHWPIFMLLDEDRLGVDGPVLFLARLVATFAAAAAVTYGLERPFRTRMRLPRRQLAIALVVCTGLVAAAALVLPEQPPAGVTLAIGDGNGAGALDAVVPAGDEAASVAVVGGSMAESMLPGFEAWNAESSDQVRVHTHIAAGCLLSGPGPVRLAGETIAEGTDCAGFEPRLPRLLDEAGADVVLVVPSAADVGAREIDREWRHLGDPVFDDWMYQSLSDLADVLDDAGVPVVWATSPHVRLAPGGDLEGDWTSVPDNDPARVDRLNQLIRDVASGRENNHVIDLGAWAQRLSRGEFAPNHRAEGSDLSESGAVGAVAWMVPELFEVLGLDPSAAADAAEAPATTDPAAE
ncbi:MAG TPA: acyltransferase family protein [Acidimicrobiales bacterium]|nr:acyltransferase family protein [Acidimicrobiales bacterium]